MSEGVTAISAGVDHSCAVVDGAAMCWGFNNVGQLGDDTRVRKSIPVPVSGLTEGVTAISAGGQYSCAVVDGAAMCWGSNGNGRLGDGSTAGRVIPVQVRGLRSSVTAVSAGGSHSCAIQHGDARCWGSNGNGRLGDMAESGGTATIPVQVVGLSEPVLPPEFTSTTTFSVNEGTTEVGVIEARAQEGDSIMDYMISGGVDNSLFMLDSSSGTLSFNVAPDFEDVSHAAEYVIKVTAVSNGIIPNQAVTTITITVVDVEEPPVFIVATTFSVAEGTTEVGDIAAQDSDGDSILRYEISGGVDSALFTINETSGCFVLMRHLILKT